MLPSGDSTTDQPSQSFEAKLFRMAGRVRSENNATQPAEAGAGLAELGNKHYLRKKKYVLPQ